jgi:hypothetical protein
MIRLSPLCDEQSMAITKHFVISVMLLGSTSGCALDYGIPEAKYSNNGVYNSKSDPDKDIAEIASYSDAEKAAAFFVGYYRYRSNHLFATAEGFELPLIGGVIGGAAAGIFGSQTRALEAIAVGVAAGGAYEAYLAPRSRANIAADGMGAMLCLQQLAIQLEPKQDSSNFRAESTLTPLTNQADPAKAAIAKTLAAQLASGWQFIARGVSAINLKIIQRERSQTGQPDLQKVASDIQNAAAKKVQTQNQFELLGVSAANAPPDPEAGTNSCIALAG